MALPLPEIMVSKDLARNGFEYREIISELVRTATKKMCMYKNGYKFLPNVSLLNEWHTQILHTIYSSHLQERVKEKWKFRQHQAPSLTECKVQFPRQSQRRRVNTLTSETHPVNHSRHLLRNSQYSLPVIHRAVYVPLNIKALEYCWIETSRPRCTVSQILYRYFCLHANLDEGTFNGIGGQTK